MNAPPPGALDLLRSLLGERLDPLSEEERAELARTFVDAGRSAALARIGSREEGAEAVDAARETLREARRRLAEGTGVGDEGPVLASGWERVTETLDEHRERLRELPGVVGFGPGFKRSDDVRGRTPCVKVYVREKRPAGELEASEEVPARLPGPDGEEVPTDVEPFGTLRRQVAAGWTVRPVGEDEERWGGTAGAFAVTLSDGETVTLTAMHVTGADRPPLAGSPEIRMAVSRSRDEAAVPLGPLIRGTMERVDAAAIATDPSVDVSGRIERLGPIRGWRPVVEPGDYGTAVHLHGARSGVTGGVIREPVVDLPRHDLDSAILVDMDTRDGDSGAVIVDEENLALGMLVGRTPVYDGLAVFSPISLVLGVLECRFFTGNA